MDAEGMGRDKGSKNQNILYKKYFQFKKRDTVIRGCEHNSPDSP